MYKLLDVTRNTYLSNIFPNWVPNTVSVQMLGNQSHRCKNFAKINKWRGGWLYPLICDQLTAAPNKAEFTVEEHNTIMNNTEEKDREVDMTTSILELVLHHNNLNGAASQLPILSQVAWLAIRSKL